jgi:hypothetical protein
MKQLAKMQRLGARLPPVSEVAKAFESFFAYKSQQDLPRIEDTQAQLALQSFEYCISANESSHLDGGVGAEQSGLPTFGTELLSSVAKVLCKSVHRSTSTHLDLARVLLRFALKEQMEDSVIVRILTGYIELLCHSGHFQEARNVMLEAEGHLKVAPPKNSSVATGTEPRVATLTTTPAGDHEHLSNSKEKRTPVKGLDRLWALLAMATARHGHETDVLNIHVMCDQRITKPGPKASLARAMLAFHIRMSDFQGIDKWFTELQVRLERLREWQNRANAEGKGVDFAHELHQILQRCLQHGRLDFGHSMVQRVMNDSPSKAIWDEVFIWAAGCGKGADEINRMIGVMLLSNDKLPKDQQRWPDVKTINGLVEYAVSKDDPYLAERFISIGKERGIQPDAKTCILQMEYRMRVKDIDGALIAYKNLQAMDLANNADIPAVNKLIVALCNSSRHDSETVMNVAADLSDRRARFEADTVSHLALLHFDREEVEDVEDLLNVHSGHFSLSERAKILADLIAYIARPTTTVPQAWDAYTILRQFFDEAARPERTEVMLSFLTDSRPRPDLATDVFVTMRQHTRRDTRPSADTYVAFFVAAAKIKDLNSVEVVHNQLKLDASIVLSTRIWSALILAYTACGQARMALSFWDSITASTEGPTYNSIHITFRACENAPFGDLRAVKIWERLRRLGLEVDSQLWASYAAALVGNGDNQLGFSAVEKAVQDRELEVDYFLLASMFDSGHGDVKKSEIAEWAKSKFPWQWQQVEEMGFEEAENGFLYVKGLNREIEP